jgi:hypothetical protein
MRTPSRAGLLLPTYSDVLFVFIVIFSFIAGEMGWQRLLQDADTGLHIRIGDYILANRQVPTQDMFSFSLPGQTWYAFEWLTEILFSFLHTRFGLKGVVLVSGIVLAGTLIGMFQFAIRRGANSLIALALLLLAVSANSLHFHARPHIFTLLFLTVSTWMIWADRQRPGPWIWLLVPLTIVWTNLHGGFLIFFPLLALLVLGCALERRMGAAIRYAMVATFCGLASLVNPYGIKLHEHIVEIMRASWVIDTIDEFRSPQFRTEAQLHLMILFFLGLIVITPLLAKRRVTEALWILFLAYSALTSVRHGPIFTLVAVPIIAVELSEWWTAWVSHQPKNSIPAVLDGIAAQLGAGFRRPSLWTLVAVLFIALTGSIHWPTDFPEKNFPEEIIQRHADQIATARILTTDQWGDYLIYRNYPRQRVFLDGRTNYYGPKILSEYSGMMDGQRTWREILERYRFDLILCSPDAALASLIRIDPEWRTVDSDTKAVLFAKRVQ